MAKRLKNWSVLLRIFCAVALFSVGLAHKPPVVFASPIPASEFSDYVLPDGSVPIICFTGHDDDDASHPGDSGMGSGCEACRLSASLFLPQPPDTVGERMETTFVITLPVRHEAFHAQRFPPNSAPRAPPLLIPIA